MKLGVACDGWVIVSSDDIEEISKLYCDPVEHEECSVCDPLEIVTGIPCYKTVFVDELPETGISGILYVTKTDDEYSIYEWNGNIFVNVTSPESCTLQTKSVTPSLSAQTVLPDPGYSGMSEVDVDAVQRGELDEPTIGYLELPGAGTALLRTAAWVAVSGWLDTSDSIYKLFNVHDVVPSQAGTTITPTTSPQLAVAKFKWTTGPVYVAAIPPEYVIPSGTKNIVANGTGIDVSAYEFVDVAVPGSSPSGTKTITANGTGIDVASYAYADVAVPASAVDSGTKAITANGNNQDVVGYAAVDVNVPNSYGAGDEGKVVSSGALVSQSSATYTENGTYDTTLVDSITVLVSSSSSIVKSYIYNVESEQNMYSAFVAMDIKAAYNHSAIFAYILGSSAAITGNAYTNNNYGFTHTGTTVNYTRLNQRNSKVSPDTIVFQPSSTTLYTFTATVGADGSVTVRTPEDAIMLPAGAVIVVVEIPFSSNGAIDTTPFGS